MFGRGGQSETGRDALRGLVEDLSTRVADLSAQVSAIRTEWQDTKDQVRRSYQRLEQAARRAEQRQTDEPPEAQPIADTGPGSRFLAKLQEAKRRGLSG